MLVDHKYLVQKFVYEKSLGYTIVLWYLNSEQCVYVLHFGPAENGDRIAGFLFEPIQGEAGVC